MTSLQGLAAASWLPALAVRAASTRSPKGLRPSLAARGWSLCTAAAGARGAAAAAAAAVGDDTDVATAVRAACEVLGKPFPSQLVQSLQENWFATAGDLVAMSEADARSLGLPLRLKSTLAQLVAAGGSSDGGDLPLGAAEVADWAEGRSRAASGEGLEPLGVELPALAVQLVDSYLRDADLQERAGSAVSSISSSSSSSGEVAQVDAKEVDSPSTSNSGSTTSGSNHFHLPIEERRCPSLGRFQNKAVDVPRVAKRGKSETYALKESELTDSLREEFAAFHRFCTVKFFGQQSDPITDGTARKYADHLRALLGYVHSVRGVPLERLSFADALPSSSREGVAVLFDYVQWLHATRAISVRTEGLVVRAAGALAKFRFHAESKVDASAGDKPYSDLEVIKELRKMSNAAKRASKVAARTSDEAAKWIDWPDFLALVQELRRECGARDHSGRQRAPSAVAWSLQRYLIFAILSCVPDRQRTLRELEVGRTLVREPDGRWVIRHGPGDYKTGRSYGERPPLIIAHRIYPELEAFMGTWRQHLDPQHSLLFTQRNGQPLSDKSLYKIFWTTAYRITGKKCNPHLVRDSIVTFLRGSGASERELEALAIYMGHSVEMQRDTYDRRTKEQKVEPAVELLEALNRKAQGGSAADL